MTKESEEITKLRQEIANLEQEKEVNEVTIEALQGEVNDYYEKSLRLRAQLIRTQRRANDSGGE